MTTKTDITQERAAFEAWHERLYGRRPVRKGGGYAATAHTDRWTIWLACRAAVEADRAAQMNNNASCVSKLSESDKQDQFRDATKMMPSDAELEKAWDSFEAEMARHPTDDELEEFMAQFADEQGNIADDRHAEAARALLSRYGEQPAASAEPVGWLRNERGMAEGPATLDPLFFLGEPRRDRYRATYSPVYAAPVAQEPVLVGWTVGVDGGGILHAAKYTEDEAKRAGYPLAVYRLVRPKSAPVATQAQPIQWPTMPPRKGQSPVLFDDGYAEGWAKCMSECQKAVAAQALAVVNQQMTTGVQDREDAERYRWLLDRSHFTGNAGWLGACHVSRRYADFFSIEEVKAAISAHIDAARAAKGE